jgi:protein ImuB
MSATEAATRVPALRGYLRDPAAERAAAGALLDAAWATSPRVEVVEPGCVCVDLAGLPGEARPHGEGLATRVAAVGLPVRVGVGGTRTVAQLAARAGGGVTVVPVGAELDFLAPRPLALLDPAPDLAEALERWGVRTLGMLAALPPAALLARLGPAAVALRARACGEDAGPFVPQPALDPCIERLTLDWEVAALPALAFVLDRLLGRIEARLALRGAGAAALQVVLGLADGGRHAHHLALAAPLRDARTLGRLLLAELEALRLPAAVVAVTIEVTPTALAPLQADLFAAPRPSPRELGETLGRLAALVGADRVGAPAVPDTHRPDVVAMTAFPGEPAPPSAAAGGRETATAGSPRASGAPPPPAGPLGAGLVRRRLTPPRPAVVACAAGRPTRVEAEGVMGPIVAAAGPWRTAGDWWRETAWAREEWDAALPDGAVYRLAHDLATGRWVVDAVYD